LAGPVIVTATSHLGVWQVPLADLHIIAETPAALEQIEHGLQGVILVTGTIEDDRTLPVEQDLLEWLRQFCGYHSLPLLIEADGARQKPLKAWAEHEPPVPSFAEQVIHVVGLSALGTSLNDKNVHRSEAFSALSGLRIGDSITPNALIRVLAHAASGFKNIPPTARKVLLLNQAETAALQGIAHGLAHSLVPPYDAALIASLEQEKIFAVHEPIAAIVLAAGESTRFGEPKQLLDWRGQPFVRAVATKALEAGLSPVIVITGAYAESVAAAVQGLDVRIAANTVWQTGQASSIKVGIESLSQSGRSRVGGALFLLADQPHITSAVMRALVEKHAEGLYPILAPMVLDRRANPVLFDRSTFSDLLTLEGDVGGRGIFHKHRVEYLPWHDDGLLLDVDTPEQYQRLIANDKL
jgi:molybdenum cofactor cytidylyltransferase